MQSPRNRRTACDSSSTTTAATSNESLRPLRLLGPHGREAQDRTSKELVLAFGLDHIIIWRERPTDPAATRYSITPASVRGKPS